MRTYMHISHSILYWRMPAILVKAALVPYPEQAGTHLRAAAPTRQWHVIAIVLGLLPLPSEA